jgi:hypothetical protein
LFYFRKCYTSNRLLNGILQLSSRTHLILDETDLQPGNLDSKGNINLQLYNMLIIKQLFLSTIIVQKKYTVTFFKSSVNNNFFYRNT